MNKASLVREVSKRTDLPPATVARVVDTVLTVIRETVGKGHRVVLSGFGSFERRRRGARIGRNPHTGAAVKIPPRNAPVFNPGTAFRESVAPKRRKPAAKGGARKTAGRRSGRS